MAQTEMPEVAGQCRRCRWDEVVRLLDGERGESRERAADRGPLAGVGRDGDEQPHGKAPGV